MLQNMLLALGITSCMAVTPALAAYTQEASTFSAGGGISASSNYDNLGIIGQPGIVGSSTGGSYTANHGFISVLGDGFKILYPVIAATPGSLTFTLKSGLSGNQPIGISNAGGSTLNWTVTKGADPNNIFSFDLPNGTGAGTVTVTADAAGLAPGPYSSSLTIAGAGIDQTVQVLLDLSVSPSSYLLTVTLKQAVAGKGGGNVVSTSPDSRLTCDNVSAGEDVVCSQSFPADGTVTLFQAPGSDSQWATWGFDGCDTAESCQVALTGDMGSTVTFPYSYLAKAASGPEGDSLATVYGLAASSDTINTRAVTLTEGDAGSTVTFNGGKTIDLVGGLDAYYNPTGNFTNIRNTLKIQNGRLNVKGLKIQP